MLNAVGQIGHDGVHVRATRHFLHMQIGLRRFSLCQNKVTGSPFVSNLELVTTPGAATSLVALLKRDVFSMQELAEKERGRFDILPVMFNAEGVISTCQRQKQRCASARQGIENAQPPRHLLAECASEKRDIEQHARKDLVRLPLITTRLGHLRGHKRCVYIIKWTQEWPRHISNGFKVLVCLAASSQARQYNRQQRMVCASERDQQVVVSCQHNRLNVFNSRRYRTGKQLWRSQFFCHTGILR